MPEQVPLALSSTLAAAQISLALWLSHLFLLMLRSRRQALGGHMAIAVLTMLASTFAWRGLSLGERWLSAGSSGGGSIGADSLGNAWRSCWLISSILAATYLILMVSRWLVQGAASVRTDSQRPPGVLDYTLASAVAVLALVAIGQEQSAHIQSSIMRSGGWLYMIAAATMMSVSLASTLELTFGETGTTLLELPWSRLSLAAGIAFLVQIGLGILVIARLSAAATPVETMLPVVFCFGMLLLGYIAWCIPRRMQSMAKQKTVTGQASLALAGWISLLCFALAAALK